MPFEEQEATGGQLLQQERCGRFAPQAADRIRAAEHCLFSLLPHEELSRMAGEWYDACSQAMLRGNYEPIDTWVRSQSQRAVAHGFAPGDLLQLLAICRRSAIELESWNEDILSAVDEVIHEAFGSLQAKTLKNIPDRLDQKVNASSKAETIAPSVETEERMGERRRFARNRLQLPIRVKRSGNQGEEEVTRTRSISRGGLYFLTSEEYKYEQPLKINFPYWNEPGGINRDYAVKIVRIDRLPNNTWGVGVDFLESLGRVRHPSQRQG